MMKEIAEQPTVIGDTLQAFVNPLARRIEMPKLPVDLAKLSRLTIVACGTAYLAGYVAKYWLEKIARLPVEIDVASEFRYREAPLDPDGATLVISQSGETADTLAALRYAKAQGHKIIAVLNSAESTMAREADVVLHTLAGPEIGVASTKAFTTALVVLAALAIATARARGAIDARREAELSAALLEVPARAAEVLNHDATLKAIALKVAEARDVLFLGRGTSYPIAMEGALKLKEISVHPRRRLRRRRDEARPDRPDRRDRAGDRGGAERRSVREDRVQPAGGAGARRARRLLLRRRGHPPPGRRGDGRGRAAEGRSRSSRRSSTRSRCSCSPITRQLQKAPMSTSRATLPRA